MSTNEIKGIIFDLDGVVIDSEKTWDEANAAFLRNHNAIYDRQKTKPLLMGRGIKEGAVIMMDQYGFEGDVAKLAEERRRIAIECLGNDITFIDGFKDFYNNTSKIYRDAVATGLERSIFAPIDSRLHITKMFNGHVYSISDIGLVSKPNPDIFLYAASKIGVAPANCIVIEDAPNGVEAAKRAGMRCIALTTTVKKGLDKADIVVDAYSQIDLSKM